MLSHIIRDLRAATDYEVMNGGEALVAVAQQRSDLTLMPIMDGSTITFPIREVLRECQHGTDP